MLIIISLDTMFCSTMVLPKTIFVNKNAVVGKEGTSHYFDRAKSEAKRIVLQPVLGSNRRGGDLSLSTKRSSGHKK